MDERLILLSLIAVELCILMICDWQAVSVFTTVLAVAFILYVRRDDSLVSAKGRAVLITGCDSGFGKVLVQRLDTLGCTVFAGCLQENGEGACDLRSACSDRVHVLQMDVTRADQIEEVKSYIMQTITKADIPLWCVVNNAGLNFCGDIELTTVKQFEKVCDINIMGIVRVTKAFLPLLRKTKGRVVNVTSVKGLLSTHGCGAYNITKFAGETFSDILRLEMKKWGMDVSIIEPGNYGGATGCLYMPRIKADFNEMWENMDSETRDAYGREYVDSGWKAAETAIPTACMDISPVVDAMTHAVLAKHPHTRYLIPGGIESYDIYKLLIMIKPFIPTALLDYLTEYVFNSDAPKPAALQT